MIKTITSAVAALAFAAVATASAAQPRYDAALPSPDGKSLAERMVICDTTLFLESRPNFNAQRMFAVRNATLPDPELLLPPYFIGPDRWHHEDLKIAYGRLRARGEVDFDDLRAAHEQYAEPVLDRYVGRSRNFTIPRVELSRQARACSRFARDLRLGRG